MQRFAALSMALVILLAGMPAAARPALGVESPSPAGEQVLGVERPGLDWLVTNWYGGEPDWTYTQTTVLYEDVNGQMMFKFFSDNDELFRANAWWDPQEAQVSSEIQNTANQMPGEFDALDFQAFHTMRKRTNQWYAFAPTHIIMSDNTKWYSSNARGGMDPDRELVTADKRGDC